LAFAVDICHIQQAETSVGKMRRSVSVRYIVNDVDAAIEFYTKMLDFKVEMHPAVEFAILSRGDFWFFLT